MSFKRLLWWGVFYAFAFTYTLSRKYRCDSENENIEVKYDCGIAGFTYSRLNHFCDSGKSWKKLSEIIENSGFSVGYYGQRNGEQMFWGTKIMLCGEDGDVWDLDDPHEVFLRTKQDTTVKTYRGALTEIQFGTCFFRKMLPNDVGATNRRVVHNSASTIIDYSSDYSEVDTSILREFQESILFDSTYKADNRIANYRLLADDGKRILVSIKYEDYGKRLYFKVY